MEKLPPNSPDFNPVENSWARLDKRLLATDPRTLETEKALKKRVKNAVAWVNGSKAESGVLQFDFFDAGTSGETSGGGQTAEGGAQGLLTSVSVREVGIASSRAVVFPRALPPDPVSH